MGQLCCGDEGRERWCQVSQPLFDAGLYKVRLTSCGLGKSTEKKTPYVYFEFLPMYRVDQTRPDEAIPCPQQPRTIFLYLSQAAVDYTVQKLRAIGYPFDDFGHLEAGPNQWGCYDREVDAVCKHENYNNKLRDKWDFYTPGSIEHQALDAKAIRELDALYGKKFKENKPTHAPAQSGPLPSMPVQNDGPEVPEFAPTGPSGDEIPF